MTTPATAGSASTSLTRRASLIQTASVMSWLPMLAICSPEIWAMVSSPGTAWMSALTG